MGKFNKKSTVKFANYQQEMRKVSLCLLALLFITEAQAASYTKTLRRRMQQVVKPVTPKTSKADTGKSDTTNTGPTIKTPEKVDPRPSDNGDGTVGYKVTIGGHAWDLSWERWVWGIVFLVCGVPLNWLGLPWWKVLRLPIGAIVGFWICNYVEVYAVMPYVT